MRVIKWDPSVTQEDLLKTIRQFEAEGQSIYRTDADTIYFVSTPDRKYTMAAVHKSETAGTINRMARQLEDKGFAELSYNVDSNFYLWKKIK